MDGKAWKAARDEAGLTIDDAVYGIRDLIGKGNLSRSTLQRFESGVGRLDIIVVGCLANVYGRTVGDIDPEAGAELSKVRDLLILTIGCFTADEGHDTLIAA